MAREEAITTSEYSYTIIIEPAEEGGYVVTCPSLRGAATQGETLEEARAMAADPSRAISNASRRTGCPFRPAISRWSNRSVIG